MSILRLLFTTAGEERQPPENDDCERIDGGHLLDGGIVCRRCGMAVVQVQSFRLYNP